MAWCTTDFRRHWLRSGHLSQKAAESVFWSIRYQKDGLVVAVIPLFDVVTDFDGISIEYFVEYVVFVEFFV